jgi:uncharacterized membrane protein
MPPPDRIIREGRTELIAAQKHEVFLGPIPSPSILGDYRKLDPSYPDRIIRMAEQHAEADVLLKNREASAIGRGQVFSFILGIIGFGTAIFLAVKKLEAGAIAAAIGGIAPIIIAALANFQQKK